MSSIFDDDPMFTVSETKWIGPPPPLGPDEMARGDSWYIRRAKDMFELHYMAGEHGGGSRQIHITREEADGITTGALAVDDVLISNGR